MADLSEMIAGLIPRIDALGQVRSGRVFIAISGPPACGKSTFSAALVHSLQERGHKTGLVAMDGFHLDNTILDARGLRARKGAPETFDLAGFVSLLNRLRNGAEVIAPTFDRTLDVSVGSSMVIDADVTHVVVEGNYLMLDRPGWRDLSDHWDLSVAVTAPFDVLRARLVQRWLDHGFDTAGATAKAQENDLPNAQLVYEHSLPADIQLSSG